MVHGQFFVWNAAVGADDVIVKGKAFDALAGLDYLKAAAAEIRLPTYAIGGITAANLPEVQAAGISRVAVSSAVTAAAGVSTVSGP